jgi:hypothetical protein
LTDGYEDPTLLVGSNAEKELGRARKLMGAAWVAEVGPMLGFENIGLTLHITLRSRSNSSCVQLLANCWTFRTKLMHQRQIVPSVKIVGDPFLCLVTVFLI